MPAMARRSRRDRYSNVDLGPVPRGADTPPEEGPSRSARKRESEELQSLGEQVAELPAETIATLPLPEPLVDALASAKRIGSFGGRRRHLQYIGKLMRRLDPGALDAVRDAVSAARAPSARQTALLHRAERERDELLESDAALERWLADDRAGDAQRLRSLIRQARKDAREARPGEAPRRGKAYREIFAIVRARLERV
jgi:ribosome-associated protein